MDVLADLQSCQTTNGSVYVSEGLDFTELDTLIGDLKTGLKFLGASPECESAAISFFCLYLFGLCDASGSLHRPSSSDCITISTDTCANEWAIAATQFPLPQCESFPATTPSLCEGMKTNSCIALSNKVYLLFQVQPMLQQRMQYSTAVTVLTALIHALKDFTALVVFASLVVTNGRSIYQQQL